MADILRFRCTKDNLPRIKGGEPNLTEGMINLPDDFLEQFKEMKDDVKENSKATMELSFNFKAFTETQALEQKLMRKDIDQNTKDIAEIKADRKFVQQTAIAEIIKYAIIGVCILVAALKFAK